MGLIKDNSGIQPLNDFFPDTPFYVHPSESEGIMVRPQGKSLSLNKSPKSFEEILGIAPSFTSPSDAMIRLISTEKNTQDLVNCYVDPTLKVNKKICLWCMRRTECDLSEQTFQNKSMKYVFYKKKGKNQSIKSDVEIIKNYLENRQYQIKYGKVFSDSLDPFKPGLTTQGSRTISVFKLEDLNYDSNNQRCNWGHIFFSSILGRTLTVFEALIINSYINMASEGINLSVIDNSDSAYSLPSVKDLKDFFFQLSGNRELNLPKKSLREIFYNKGFVGEKLKSLSNDFHLIKSLYLNTQKYFETGFFDKELELFYSYANGMSLDDCIVELFHIIQNELQRNFRENKSNEEFKFFQPRKKCYILSGSKNISLPLPINYQIVRIDVVKGLKQPWVLVDGIDQQICLKGRKSNVLFPTHWSNIKLSSMDELLFSISKNGKKSKFIIWQGKHENPVSRHSNNPFLFLPVDIYQFMSMNLIGQSRNFSTTDVRTEIKRHNFWKLINSIFFDNLSNQGLRERRLFGKNHKEELTKFREEFNRPIYKRYSPIILIEKLSSASNYIRQYIYYSKNPTEENSQKIIHEIKLVSPGFMVGDRKYDDLVWIFQRVEEEKIIEEEYDGGILEEGYNGDYSLDYVIQQTGDRIHTLSPWKCVTSDGWEFKYNHNGKLKRFCDLLNFDGEFKFESFFLENPCVWMSPMLIHQFKSRSEKLTEIKTYIRNRINQEGKFGGLMFAFSSELLEIEILLGKLRCKGTKITIGDDQLFMLLPNIAISEFSQNFLPLKIT